MRIPSYSPALALFAPLAGIAAVETVEAGGYIKIGDIKGESQDPAHLEWSTIDSFSWGISCQPDPAGGTSDVHIQEVTVTKALDKASPKLMLNACSGTPVGNVTVSFDDRDGTGEAVEYLKVELKECIVTSYKSSSSGGGSGGAPVPIDSISLSFSEVTVTYTPADGSDPVVETRSFVATPGS